MQNKHLIECTKIMHIHEPQAAGTSATDSDIVDTAGFGGVLFLVPITDCLDTGVLTVTVEHSDTNTTGGMAATTLNAAATATADDDLNEQVLALDVKWPQKRYLRLEVAPTVANIATGDVIAILYDPVDEPTTQDSTNDVADSDKAVGPAAA